MIRFSLPRVFLALIGLFCLNVQSYAQVPSNPFKRILASRDEINTISFMMEYTQDSSDNKVASRYQVWISKDKIRYDKIDLNRPSSGDFYERQFVCINCEGSYMFTGRVGGDIADKKSTPVIFYDKGDVIANGLDMNWRYIGVYPSGLSGLIALPEFRAAKNYRAFSDNPKGHKISLRDGEGGIKQLEIKYNTSSESTLTVFIDDAKARTVRMTQYAKGYGEIVEHFYDDPTQRVIPTRIISKILSGESNTTEEMRISKVELNKPIDPQIFTLAGCELPDYTIIQYKHISDPRKFPIWRDGKVDKNYTMGQMADEGYQRMKASGATVPDSPPSSAASAWPFLLGGGLLAALGSILLLRKARKR